MSNVTHKNLVEVLTEHAPWAQVGDLVSDWRNSRYSATEAVAFIEAGVLSPTAVPGASRYSTEELEEAARETEDALDRLDPETTPADEAPAKPRKKKGRS